MPVAWSGPDPTQVADTDTYEMGTAQKANQDITITGIRVWSGASPIDLSGRTGTIWSTGGAVLSTINLPTTLTAGWVTFDLDTPVERTLNQQWIVSFGSGGNYGFVNQGLNADVVSADTAVTSLGFANAPGGVNGRFNATPGDFPATGTAGHGFYGIDIVYTLGIGGNTAPDITALHVSTIDAVASVLVDVTDAETLVGATVRYDWGDFTTPSVSNYPDLTESHTYAASGVYAILVSVTDSDGAAGYAAAPVVVTIPPGSALVGFDITTLQDGLTMHVAALGNLERMLLHEPKTAQTDGISAAIWFNTIDAVPLDSGLDSTSLRIEFVLRFYDNMLREPLDAIDQRLVDIVNRILNMLNGDFTLGGRVKQVDIHGAYGPALRVASGYIPQDGKLMRAVSVYIPLIVSDVYGQEA